MTTEQILEIPENAKTPNYDKMTHDVKKLLTATAATYIPELCDALRKDLFPRATDETFARDENKGVRDDIRDRILDDWSNQRNWPDSPWGDSVIKYWFPKWLRHPNVLEANEKSVAAAQQAHKDNAIARRYQKNLSVQKLEIDKLMKNLPEVPKQLEQQEEEEEPEEEESVTYEPLGIHQAPEAEMPTPIAVYEDTVTYAEKLWSALVSNNIHKPKKLIPAQTSDPLLDFIKPSRKLWLRTLKGLDQPRVNHMLMCLVWIDMLIQDRLKEAKEINKERKEIQK